MFRSQMSEHGQIDVMMWTFHIVDTDNVRIEGEARRQRILIDMLQHERNDDEDNGWVR